jgi:hypothetical protein
MTTRGYTLIYSVVPGNVLGAVIAPRGTEDYPKDRRMFVWRTMLRPLVEEVAEYEEFPKDDAKKVAQALFQFCLNEGLAVPVDEEKRKGK